MTRIRFENAPSTNTPINADNLNKLNNVVISSSEPTTGEEVWLKKTDTEKNIYIKNDSDAYEKFILQDEGVAIGLRTPDDNIIQQHWCKYRQALLRADVFIQGTLNTGKIINGGMPFAATFPQYCSTEFGIFKLNTDGSIDLINGNGAWGQVMLTFFEYK